MCLTRGTGKFNTIGSTVVVIQLISIILVQLATPTGSQYTFGQKAQKLIDNTSVYENKDFGFKLSYPSHWIVKETDLFFNSVVALQLIDTNIYDYTNKTIAEVDIKIFPTYANRTANDISLKDVNTSGQFVLNVTNSTLGGHRSLNIVDYRFEGGTIKDSQVWTVLPKHNALLLIHYIAQPGIYQQYLNVVELIIKSFKFID